MPAADASNPIEAVRARLDGGRKWIKGQAIDDAGNACIMGALSDVASWGTYGNGVRAERQITGVVEEQYPDRASDGVHCVAASFNDHPATTWADVDLVLDKAARRWDEAVR